MVAAVCISMAYLFYELEKTYCGNELAGSKHK